MLFFIMFVVSTVDVDYGHCDFILESADEVERLWGTADYCLDGARNSTMLILFESLACLRANEVNWDEK